MTGQMIHPSENGVVENCFVSDKPKRSGAHESAMELHGVHAQHKGTIEVSKQQNLQT